MEARMKNPAMVLGDAMTGIQYLYKAMHQGGVPATTLELVHMRASQINGCSACVSAGVQSARKAGESEERLVQLTAWRESDAFTDAERAALALTESATRLADRAGCGQRRSVAGSNAALRREGPRRDHLDDRDDQHVQPHQRHHQGACGRDVVVIAVATVDVDGRLRLPPRDRRTRHRLPCQSQRRDGHADRNAC